jgi:hypothetical protein
VLWRALWKSPSELHRITVFCVLVLSTLTNGDSITIYLLTLHLATELNVDAIRKAFFPIKFHVFIRSHVSEATAPLQSAGGVVFGL